VAENQQNSQDLQPNSFKAFMNPVVVLAGIIVLSVLFLILCAIFGWDKGVLQNMSRTDYARGLITYLFAVVTIGTAVVLVVSALTTSADDRHEKQFQRGKEILSLLLGVFGTIVGFYFGAEIGKGAEETLRIAPIHLSSDTVAPNTKFKFTTVVSGGEPPYQFGVGLGQEPAEMTGHVGEGGWIEMEVTAPQLVDNKEKTVQVELQVLDANGHMGKQSTKVTVKPSP
jgi:hypothetical protein